MLQKIEKPWGFEEIWAHTTDYVGKIIGIKKGHRLSLQYHEIKVESIRVLEGEMDLVVEHDGDVKKTLRLKPGDSYHIPAGTRHRMIAVQDTIFMEVSTPHLDDVIRLEDDYGRTSAGS